MSLKKILISLMACGMMTSCTAEETGTMPYPGVQAFPAQNLSDPLPRLSPGPHMGFIEGFEDLDTTDIDRRTRADQLRQQAISHGMTVSRVQIDWATLEPARGVYNGEALLNALEFAGRQDIDIFVTLSTLDSEELTLPDYLMDSDGGLRPGLTMSSPEVMGAFDDLLEWMVPVLTNHEVFALSLGNEIDSMIHDHVVLPGDALIFFQRGTQKVRMLDSMLAATVTFSGGAIYTEPAFVQDLWDSLDVVTYNHYCLDPDLTVNGRAAWARELVNWKNAANGKQILIQELGCPAGYDLSEKNEPQWDRRGIRGSEKIHAEFFSFMTRKIAEDDQLRVATVFQLYDWSPQLLQAYLDPLRAAGEPELADLLDEWLATSGLCRWTDTSCRSGWKVWLSELRLVVEARNIASTRN